MDYELLDLHDISLLLNYERASTEPRFRGAKLREVADNNTSFQSVRLAHRIWDERAAPKVGYIFDKKPTSVPDTPKNMLPVPVPDNLKGLSDKEIETIFWQARAHDGCFKAVTLFQHFFDLFPSDTPLRVRTAKGTEFETTISNRMIIEMFLIKPTLMSMSCVLPDSRTYICGESGAMIHAVVGFSGSIDDNSDTIVDLSSMQFGENGRGLGGKGTFLIETLDDFYDRVPSIASTVDKERVKISSRVGPCPDDKWLKGVARRAKARWENRDKDSWCGHCGAPGAKNRCSKCKKGGTAIKTIRPVLGRSINGSVLLNFFYQQARMVSNFQVYIHDNNNLYL